MNAPYDNKDKLKERGYKWDGERKIWSELVSHADLTAEADWLRVEVYANKKFKLELEKIDAYNRFSYRRGTIEVIDY